MPYQGKIKLHQAIVFATQAHHGQTRKGSDVPYMIHPFETAQILTEAGCTDIYKTSLLGVGDLEKRLGRKKFNEVLGKFIVKPAGAPTLVPETDPRKPYFDAASDFNQ